MKESLLFAGSVLALITLCFNNTQAQVVFTDVAVEKGLTYQGKTFGSSWGDLNGNGYPDLYMSCHMNNFDPFYENDIPRIYYNESGDLFQEQVLEGFSTNDWHGAGLMDLNNNGSLDIYNTVGGSGGNILLINNGSFEPINRAQEFNADYDGGRGRTPAFFDVDNDGFIDVMLNNVTDPNMPTALLRNDGGTSFIDASVETDLVQLAAVFSSVANIGAPPGRHDVLTVRNGVDIYSIEDEKFVFQNKLDIGSINDIVTGDFNGNLKTDVFVARGKKLSEIIHSDDGGIKGVLQLTENDPVVSISFQAGDSLQLWFAPRQPVEYEVHFGASEAWTKSDAEGLNVELNSESLTVDSLQMDFPDNICHLSVYFKNGIWTVSTRTRTGLNWAVGLELTSNAPITDLSTSGIRTAQENYLQDVFYFNLGNYEFEQVLSPALLEAINSAAVVAADFDNDMDLDIYVHGGGFAKNAVNYLLVNDGEGNFTRVDGAWGATGYNGGLGESATVVDYNNDGFMDIFLANGKGIFHLFDAGLSLYENSGNSNHWLKLVLKGNQSNPAGIGARVLAYAGGKAQVRTQTAGMHWVSQNDSRIHFGMGQNAVVDSVIIHWPSGIVQKLFNLQVDKIMTVVETEQIGGYDRLPRVARFRVQVMPSSAGIKVISDDPIKTIDVFNVPGQEIKSRVLSGGVLQHELKLATGVYLIRLINESGAVGVQKVFVP